jgi:hypothetical protein
LALWGAVALGAPAPFVRHRHNEERVVFEPLGVPAVSVCQGQYGVCEVCASAFYVSWLIAKMVGDFDPRGIERSENNVEGFGIEVAPFEETTGLPYNLPLRVMSRLSHP